MNVAELLRTRVPSERPRLRIALLASAFFVATILFFAVFGALVAPEDPARFDLLRAGEPPSAEYLLGTDQLGRDILSRAIAGTRTPLLGGLAIALGAAFFGSLLGIPAGYVGGFIDTLLMRWVDLMISFPGLLVAIVVVGVLGVSYVLAVAVLVLFVTPYEVRMMRGLALEQRVLPYVEAARTAGLSPLRIMARHVWPNTLAILVADAFLNFALGIVGLSTLSFLGLGLPLGTPDWGRMLFEAKELLFENPFAAIAPALLISLTATSVAILGDACFERLTQRGREL